MATHSVFLPGESQGRGSLVGFRLWGRTEPDTTEATQQQGRQSQWMAESNQSSSCFWGWQRLTARWNECNTLYLDTHRVTQMRMHLSKITEWDTYDLCISSYV